VTASIESATAWSESAVEVISIPCRLILIRMS